MHAPAVPPNLTTRRLVLESLRPNHAEEMASVVDDLRLHTFVGGTPDSLDGLRERYRRVSELRADDGSVLWPTFVVRRRDLESAIGTVHATLDGDEAGLGWVIGVASQGQGFATEAATALMAWVEARGFTSIYAVIRSGHGASAAVARHLGLCDGDEEIDGDRIWRKPRG